MTRSLVKKTGKAHLPINGKLFTANVCNIWLVYNHYTGYEIGIPLKTIDFYEKLAYLVYNTGTGPDGLFGNTQKTKWNE
jgi:hypothetical protein